MQFVLDLLDRPLAYGSWAHLLKPSIDAALVAARVKAKLGPLAFNTVSHRLAVLVNGIGSTSGTIQPKRRS